MKKLDRVRYYNIERRNLYGHWFLEARSLRNIYKYTVLKYIRIPNVTGETKLYFSPAHHTAVSKTKTTFRKSDRFYTFYVDRRTIYKYAINHAKINLPIMVKENPYVKGNP